MSRVYKDLKLFTHYTSDDSPGVFFQVVAPAGIDSGTGKLMILLATAGQGDFAGFSSCGGGPRHRRSATDIGTSDVLLPTHL